MMFKIIVVFILIICNFSVKSEEWWENSFIYQIYPRSFKDSNGDGIGDINGITNKLNHLSDLNVSAFWISPFFKSPMYDFGYDISNFTDIDSKFGNLNDFNNLIIKAKSLNLKVIIDFVPNHSSDEHIWFQNSIKRIKPYDDYYIWKNATIVNGTRYPPNNWLSVNNGSAWEWNSIRQQYYLHQFTKRQPDLNYRNSQLNQEMRDVLIFWINRGVDGFRIDAINHIFEDPRFLDEPIKPNTGLPADHPETLNHIYTRYQNETFELVRSWRQLLDGLNETKKILMTESYSGLDQLNLSMKYYVYGADVAFNFMFVTDLHRKSSVLDFKKHIEKWLEFMPQGNYSSNWVIDNHDNRRVTSRFGKNRADQLTMIAAILPGIAVAYYGDEIGMEDTWLLYNETVDPIGCDAGPNGYNQTSRDPQRTPFQWDNSTSAGFSTNNVTWLRVNSNYKILNLEQQKRDQKSHYSIFKKLVKLKKFDVIKHGKVEVISIANKILGIIRRIPNSSPIALLINFEETNFILNVAHYLNISTSMKIYVSNLNSDYLDEMTVDTSMFRLTSAASVIFM